jgi:pyruvate,water dikinase
MLELDRDFRYIVSLEEDGVDYSLISKVGGKSASLGELAKAGFNIPPGFCVTSDAYTHFIEKNNLWEKIEELLPSSADEAEEASKRIRGLIESYEVPEEIAEEIRGAYNIMIDYIETLRVQQSKFSVRSSGTAEDLPTASFAGQFDTYLWIEGEENIIENVKRCWSSLFTARGIEYRETKGVSHKGSLMSVAIQLMVDAKAAGVLFTLNPVDGDRSVIQMEANWGLGESVVKGITPVDTFRVGKLSFEISSRSIQTKLLQCVPDYGKREVIEKEVPAELQDNPSLSDEEIIELAKQARSIEKYYKCPQDIEFAIDKNLEFPKNIVILQSRPETMWSQRKEPLTKPKGHIVNHLLDWLVGEATPMPLISALKDKVILVVDDEPDVLDTVEETLDMCAVHKAGDYETALELLSSSTYDLVILDIMGVNGFELLKTTVARGYPAVMLTAHALTIEALNKSIKLGASCFLPKEKLSELQEFLEEVVQEGGKPVWEKLFDKHGPYFEKRLGPGWKEEV